VLADQWKGKPLNAPNDVVVHPDGGIWFTDPGYGILMEYEGNKAKQEIKEAVTACLIQNLKAGNGDRRDLQAERPVLLARL